MTDSLPGSMRVTAAICLMRGGMILSFIAKVYVNTYTTQQKNKEFLRIPGWRKKSVMHPYERTLQVPTFRRLSPRRTAGGFRHHHCGKSTRTLQPERIARHAAWRRVAGERMESLSGRRRFAKFRRTPRQLRCGGKPVETRTPGTRLHATGNFLGSAR